MTCHLTKVAATPQRLLPLRCYCVPHVVRRMLTRTQCETTINKDILLDTPVGKPALLRQTFELGAAYSGELLSLTKMLGSLQVAGNTSTLSA